MLSRMEEKIDKAVDFSMTAAQRMGSADSFNADSQAVGLKWRDMKAIHEALESVEKREALTRLLNSSLVSTGGSSYVSDVFKVFFDPSLTGLLYLGTAKK